MDVIQLPAVPITTGLAAAFGVLRTCRRSALVTDAPDGLRLITAGAIVGGLAAGLPDLSKVSRYRQVPVAGRHPEWRSSDAPGLLFAHAILTTAGAAPAPPLGTRHARWPGPLYTMADTFPTITGDHALVAYGIGTVVLLTRHETVADESGDAPRSCYCADAFEHPYDSLPAGGVCPQDGSAVNCAR